MRDRAALGAALAIVMAVIGVGMGLPPLSAVAASTALGVIVGVLAPVRR